MNAVTLTQAYTKLSEKLGKETAETLTTFITETVKDDVESSTKNLATKEDLANTKAEMIKWMFIFWVGQLAAMFGLLYFFIKK